MTNNNNTENNRDNNNKNKNNSNIKNTAFPTQNEKNNNDNDKEHESDIENSKVTVEDKEVAGTTMSHTKLTSIQLASKDKKKTQQKNQ